METQSKIDITESLVISRLDVLCSNLQSHRRPNAGILVALLLLLGFLLNVSGASCEFVFNARDRLGRDDVVDDREAGFVAARVDGQGSLDVAVRVGARQCRAGVDAGVAALLRHGHCVAARANSNAGRRIVFEAPDVRGLGEQPHRHGEVARPFELVPVAAGALARTRGRPARALLLILLFCRCHCWGGRCCRRRCCCCGRGRCQRSERTACCCRCCWWWCSPGISSRCQRFRGRRIRLFVGLLHHHCGLHPGFHHLGPTRRRLFVAVRFLHRSGCLHRCGFHHHRIATAARRRPFHHHHCRWILHHRPAAAGGLVVATTAAASASAVAATSARFLIPGGLLLHHHRASARPRRLRLFHRRHRRIRFLPARFLHHLSPLRPLVAAAAAAWPLHAASSWRLHRAAIASAHPAGAAAAPGRAATTAPPAGGIRPPPAPVPAGGPGAPVICLGLLRPHLLRIFAAAAMATLRPPARLGDFSPPGDTRAVAAAAAAASSCSSPSSSDEIPPVLLFNVFGTITGGFGGRRRHHREGYC